jgi:guanylate kinase
MQAGSFLEQHKEYQLAHHVQEAVDVLILPGIERLQARSKKRDAEAAEYLQRLEQAEHEGE